MNVWYGGARIQSFLLYCRVESSCITGFGSPKLRTDFSENVIQLLMQTTAPESQMLVSVWILLLLLTVEYSGDWRQNCSVDWLVSEGATQFVYLVRTVSVERELCSQVTLQTASNERKCLHNLHEDRIEKNLWINRHWQKIKWCYMHISISMLHSNGKECFLHPAVRMHVCFFNSYM